MADYEQFNTSNPDKQSNSFMNNRKGSGLSKILNSKNSFVKYIIILSTGLLIIILSIYLVSKSSQLSNLKEENETWSNQWTEIKSKEHDLRQQFSDLSATERTLTTENDQLTKSISDYKDKNKKLNEENADNNSKLQEIQRELDSTNSKIQDLNEQNDTVKKKIKGTEGTINDYDKEITDWKNKISTLQEKLNGKGDDKEKEQDVEEKGIDSTIITNSRQVEWLKKWINQGVNYTFKLLYRASKHGYGSTEFHKYVDGQEFTLSVMKDGTSGSIIGGFTTQSWSGNGFKQDETAFIFNWSPNEKYYPVNDFRKAIYCHPSYLPVFGEGDIYLSDSETSVYFPISYGDGNNKLYEITDGKTKAMKWVELEVFRLIPKN